MKKFIGRKPELKALQDLKNKKTASLFVCKGRRRVGKSRLIKEFGKSFDCYIEIQGLAPAEGQNNQDQIDNFVSQLKKQSKLPNVSVSTWGDVFDLLASVLEHAPTLVMLDEISWMGRYDVNFAGYLKIFWDKYQSDYNNLMICLCGSVSTWIEANILNSTHFVGRISSVLTLRELGIDECREFFGDCKSNISSLEKLRYLSVAGGIPKYLEELNLNESFDSNLKKLAFSKSGFFYLEFASLFNNSFDKEKSIYGDIVELLEKKSLSVSEITKTFGKRIGGNYTSYLRHLEQAGFVSKDFIWNLNGKKSKISRYRLSDNYLRFYFRCIKPRISKIEQGVDDYVGFDSWGQLQSIMGLQFENLIYSNLKLLLQSLDISANQVLSIGPYWQKKNSKNKGGCQVDLMILTKFDTAYLCEIKFKKKLGQEVISEVEKKLDVLQRPKHLSVRPVLLYAGELSEEVEGSEYFYKMVDWGEMLK